MKGPWVKIWRKMLTDEHLALLTDTHGDKAFRVWVTLLLRSEDGTVLDSRQLLSCIVRAKQEKFDRIIDSMLDAQMISINESGQIMIPKWNSYQECKSAPRMRALRERQSSIREASQDRHSDNIVTGRRIEGNRGLEGNRSKKKENNTSAIAVPKERDLLRDAIFESFKLKIPEFASPAKENANLKRLTAAIRRKSESAKIDPAAAAQRMVETFWRLHESGKPFYSDFTPSKMMAAFESIWAEAVKELESLDLSWLEGVAR